MNGASAQQGDALTQVLEFDGYASAMLDFESSWSLIASSCCLVPMNAALR
jgi:hypothetical protein